MILFAVAPSAWAEDDAVARASLGGAEVSASVFFLLISAEPGAVAVGAAHSFDPTLLAESGEVSFRLGDGVTKVAVSRRYYAKRGRSHHEMGATLRDDFVVFQLEEAPGRVRVLDAADALPLPGDPVRVLGIAVHGDGTEIELLGTVVVGETPGIEIDLDGWHDLRGWGGAPVLDAQGHVLGLLQSARPGEDGLRVGVGPVAGVVDALARPYEGGLGRLFATMAPVASAANSSGARRRAATGSPFGSPDPERTAAAVVAAATRDSAIPALGATESIQLEIEHPGTGARIGDSAGVFLAGRALALSPEIRRFDIIVVIDTSVSTRQPTGVDVDGDGEVGVPIRAEVQGPGDLGSTDPGDSILAAEILAAQTFLKGLDPRRSRVGLVTFAGVPVAPGLGGLTGVRVKRAARTEEPLSSDFDRLESALERVRKRGSSGMTHMAAGVDQATFELLGLEGSISKADPGSEKVVLFFTDGEPTLPHLDSEARNVRAVLGSARRARRSGVRIHSFAIGPEALAGPIATLEMAAISAGLFTPVRDPGRLVQFMEGVNFAHIDRVLVRNLTTGERAYQVRVHADGTWDALVPLASGENRIEVRARSTTGSEAVAHTLIHHARGAGNPTLPVELVSKHNELLELRLRQIRQVRIDALREELAREIEIERLKAHERASRQRKELELEAVAAGP